MRQPTTTDAALGFWRRALAHYQKAGTMKGFAGSIHESCPEAGFYLRRYVSQDRKTATEKAARIFLAPPVVDDSGQLLEPERFVCEIAGQQKSAEEEWTWLVSHPISEAEYREREMERLSALF